MPKGITGILRPNGEFLSCNYGNHGLIATTIPQEEEMSCIYFSSSNIDSLLYLNDEITKEQLKWVIHHINEFDEEQCKIWKDYMHNKIFSEGDFIV